MRRHVLLPLFVTAVLLLVAFSTGSAVFLLPAVLLLLVLLFAWVSVRWVVATINLQAASGQRRVYRNEPAELMVRVTHRCPLPVAPIRLCLEEEDALGEGELVVDDAARRSQTLRIPCQTCHVGPARVGVRCCVVEDVFGLFSARVLPGQQPAELLVLRVVVLVPLLGGSQVAVAQSLTHNPLRFLRRGLYAKRWVSGR